MDRDQSHAEPGRLVEREVDGSNARGRAVHPDHDRADGVCLRRAPTNDDDRAVGVCGNLDADGAQKQTGESATTPGADDEKPGVSARLDEHAGRALERLELRGHVEVRVHAVRAFHPLGQNLVPELGSQVQVRIAHIGVHHVAGDVQDPQRTVEPTRFLGGPGQGLVRMVGAVIAHDDRSVHLAPPRVPREFVRHGQTHPSSGRASRVRGPDLGRTPGQRPELVVGPGRSNDRS